MGVFVGSAMATGANVEVTTQSYRVTEAGVCEDAGTIMFSGTIAGGNGSVAAWDGGGNDTIVTMDLLSGAALCRSIGTDVDGDGKIDVTDPAEAVLLPAAQCPGIVGNVYVAGKLGSLSIKVLVPDQNGLVLDDDWSIQIGDEADTDICVNLTGADLHAGVTGKEELGVNIFDNAAPSNNYTGDKIIAHVYPPGHDVALCSKAHTKLDTCLTTDGCICCDEKNGMLRKPIPSFGAAQDQTICGCANDEHNNGAGCPICLVLRDDQEMFDENYTIEIKLNKEYVFFDMGVVSVEDKNGATVTPDTVTYYDADDNVTWNQCDAVRVKLTGVSLSAPLASYYVSFNLSMDTCKVTTGLLNATVSFQREPCGDSYTKTLDVADLCRLGEAVDGDLSEALFPYAPNFDEQWWVGLALTNLTPTEITVDLDIYEADGDLYETSVTVPGHGITTQLAGDLSPTLSAGSDAQFGDERFWIHATSDVEFTGFLMMGDGAQAQGYLPLD